MTKTLEPTDVLREFEESDDVVRKAVKRKYRLNAKELDCAAELCGQAIARILIPPPTVPGMSQVDYDIAVARFVTQGKEKGDIDPGELSDLGIPDTHIEYVAICADTFIGWFASIAKEVFEKHGISMSKSIEEGMRYEDTPTFRILDAAAEMHLEYRRLKKRINDKYGDEMASVAIQMEVAEKQLTRLRARWEELLEEHTANA
jgi:hypothetical protein